MLIKIAIVVFLLVIIYTLFSSFIFLARDNGQSDRVVRRLSWRIGLSLVLVLSLFAAYKLGWIEPGGVSPVQYDVAPAEQGS